MTPEEFRAAGHELIDWIADRRLTVEERRVKPDVEPGDVRGQFPTGLPAEVATARELLADLDAFIAPGISELQHPMHFGWFPSNGSLASILGDIASSGLSSLGISWESSPALTEVEEVVLDWARQLLGLSDGWHGAIHDTASTACLIAALAARERATDHAQADGGVRGFDKHLVVYTTKEAHSSVRKAALLAGVGDHHVRLVDTDPWTGDMNVDSLTSLVDADVASGHQPMMVVATAGTTGITAFDPVDQIVDVARAHDIWVHVDAAMAGSAMVLPEMRHLFDGTDRADSFCWNPHKWFGTILDTSILYVRDPEHLVRVMGTNPAYLRSTDGEVATQYRDWGIALGRRFRALKLWYQLRLDGLDEIQARLRRDLANAQWLREQFEALPDWEVVAPVRLQTVCVRHRPSTMTDEQVNEHTQRWVGDLNNSGRAFLSPSVLDGLWMARISVGVESTERHHLERLVALMREAVVD